MDLPFYREYDLPWTTGRDQEKKFQRLLGIIFAPYTTVMYLLAWSPGLGIYGWDWMWIGLGVMLAIGVLWFFLRTFRATLIIAASIPISVATAFIALQVFDLFNVYRLLVFLMEKLQHVINEPRQRCHRSWQWR